MTFPDAFTLADRTAVVTGAAQGIGRGLGLALAAAGADLVLVDVDTGVEETASKARELGRHAYAWRHDLSSLDTVADLAAGICAETQVDVVVNVAGVIHRTPSADAAYEDWRRVLGLNLDAVFLLCQEFGRPMLERRRGKIINVASMLSFQGGREVASYAASKHAVAGLTKALANEWAARGIQVNAIAPGYIASGVTSGIRADPSRNREILDRIPAGRWGTPADLGGAAVFLASAASDYVSGHLLAVDGGWLCR